MCSNGGQNLNVMFENHFGDRARPYQSSSCIITAAGWKTAAANVGDEAGQTQADDAAQQYCGVGTLHHPMKHKCLRRGESSLDFTNEVFAAVMVASYALLHIITQNDTPV